MPERRKPGVIRDAILATFDKEKRELSVPEICKAVNARLGDDIPPSSVRSYLRINTPGTFLRTERGHYRLVRR
jgi:site-specific DNA-methyltransferase (adenine-specific)